ncbi:hypothetical protein [Comamonas testosteroni]|uniref:hypothetical protein n=1 Tax=Comamonas testosteroni TaxID=285 RepID=UPI00391CC254
MSLISRVEISNYLTEGLESNHFANWSPMLTGITLRMDNQSSLVNITNGGGKTSMAEILLLVLSRDKSLLQRVREKSAPKGRGYTHARVEFREVDKTSFREPSLLEIDPENLPGQTRVYGVALNNDVADSPIFYSYSGTLEDSPCYTLANGLLTHVPDDVFAKKTRSIPGCQWNAFRNASEWQAHVGDAISIDVVRRNVVYQNKGSDDKNASFFSFKPRPGEGYDAAFFKKVVAPDLLTNLLNTFAEEEETNVEDTLHNSLSQIVVSEREMARKQENLQHREAAIGVDLKPVVDAGAAANVARETMQRALRVVKKDVALFQHFGAQDSAHVVLGIPRPVDKLMRSSEQDSRIRKALRGMVIHREDGIVVSDRTLSDLTNVEVRVITQTAERKKIFPTSLNAQIIDFNCDFGFSTSGIAGGGHYRKGYTREAVAKLLPLFADTSGATLSGLESAFEIAFDTAQAQIDTNPAALKLYALDATLRSNAVQQGLLTKEVADLEAEIERLNTQIKGRAENESAWNLFVDIAQYLSAELQSQPRMAKAWLTQEVTNANSEMQDMSAKRGSLLSTWNQYTKALEEAGLEGIDGIRDRYKNLTSQQRQISSRLQKATQQAAETRRQIPELQRAAMRAEQLVQQTSARVAGLNELQGYFSVFQSYFGDVDPRDVESPIATLKKVNAKKNAVGGELDKASSEYAELIQLKASSSRFVEIFGSECDALTANPMAEHREWTDAQNLAQLSLVPLEPLVAALEGFRLKYPDSMPETWIQQTDASRQKLENESREAEGALSRTIGEIKALDNLAVVDDASFGRAWAVLGDKPKRLYAMLQSMDGTAERRVAALSALTGLLSAPVFDSIEELSAAAELLEQHDIGIPLLLKEPLLKAIGTQGGSKGDLQQLAFFAGRYSRQARILLDPDFAKQQRELLVSRKAELEALIAGLQAQLKAVSFKSEDYRMATKAADALRSGAEAKFIEFTAELNKASTELRRLAPQVRADALATLEAQRKFLQKGGAQKQMELEADCDRLRQELASIQTELATAEKRASDESVRAYTFATKYVEQGGNETLAKATDDLELHSEAMEVAKEKLETLMGEAETLDDEQRSAEEKANAFESEYGSGEISRIKLVVDFSEQAGDIAFMETYATKHQELQNRSNRFIAFQSNVNFDRAASYVENLDKSEADLNDIVTKKTADKNTKKDTVRRLTEQNEFIENAEKPNWVALKRAVFDLAYELGKQAATTKAAHAEFSTLEEGAAPVTSHELYASLHAVCDRMQAPTLEEASALSTVILEAATSVSEINLQSNLTDFGGKRKSLQAANDDYAAKKHSFITKAEAEAGSKNAAFNALELDVIRRASPEQIGELNNLFLQLNVSLQKDREDAQKAISAAESANREALDQLSSLILVAQDNLDSLRKVMGRYPSGCFIFSVKLATEELIKDILVELTEGVKQFSSAEGSRAGKRANEGRIKDFLRETLIDKIFLEPKVKFMHTGIRAVESPVTEKLSTGQKVALEFMWIVRQAEYEIERGISKLSRQQANRKRQETNRVIFVDGIFSTLSDRHIIREAFNGLGSLGGNFQIIGFLHSPTWTNDSSVFPVYHVGKKLTNSNGDRLVSFTESGRTPGTVGFFTSITRPHGKAA